MKLTQLTILLSSFLLLASLIIAEEKSIGKDKFMRINPNITNEALRAELENLIIEFDVEKQLIRNSFDKNFEVGIVTSNDEKIGMINAIFDKIFEISRPFTP